MKLSEAILGKERWRRILLFVSVMGPGMITANVDNDAGGITTYTLAGAHYGHLFLWTMIPITFALILVQEMVARMGVVTGKGLADLIRENYGVKLTFWVLIALVVTNLGNIVAEFAGVAASMGLFGVPKALAVFAAALFVWWLVTQGDYKSVEKIFLFACLFYVTYALSCYAAHPHWRGVLKDTVTPRLQLDRSALAMLVGLIGTTIAPWMQFYQQSATVDKGLQASTYKYARLDVILGCIATNVVAVFIIVACSATLHTAGIRVDTAAEAALSLKPLAGKWASTLFAFGLLNASLFAASILPLSTAYSVCEGMGWQTGLDRSFDTAPQFYGLYTLLIAAGALVVCWPGFPLIKVMYWSQVVNGLLLPVILILCLQLSAREDLMGEYKNGPWFNWAAWTLTAAMSAVSIAAILSPLWS